ncbi:MAG: alkaline phosphatase PhoX [Phycisphaerales bacterium]
MKSDPLSLSRRSFLLQAAATPLAFSALSLLLTRTGFASGPTPAPFGPIKRDPHRLLDLPEGFTYTVLIRNGDTMTDGLFSPGQPDGMAAFGSGPGKTTLIRNHEIIENEGMSAFGKKAERLDRVDFSRVYDRGKEIPPFGGTTTLIYNHETDSLEASFMSLAGTCYNCAGGPTPWNSWLSCEEDVTRAGGSFQRDHGYVFEVPVTSSPGLVYPKPITAMGRFRHEATAVDPNSGVVYLTEDRPDGILYRYIPNVPGKLHEGGRFQVLRVKGRPSCDTRNWESRSIKLNERMDVEWFDIDGIDSPADDLRYRGYDRGAARFARNEGMWYGNDGVYFASTNGGPALAGQIWRYVPSPHEGTPQEKDAPATLTLFVESPEASIMNMCDNICVAPWGDLFVCEDGTDVNRVLQVTREGEVHVFARNALSKSEFCGGCFSPDGSVFFVNSQADGATYAIKGPWQRSNASVSR